ncbi:hypothetical protein B0H14DRAFT_3515797 [Mycena olivaceomarginata]|nr:hypothetical protein B0H14DRAFT_3515797 [Mycena olivaceomarginata]
MHIAQDVVEQFLDALHVVDPNAMKACGLVCTSWVPRSRYHLFSSVCVSAKNLLHLDYDGEPLWLWNLDWIHECPNLSAIGINVHTVVGTLEPLHLHIRSWADCGSILELKLVGKETLPLPAILDLVACVPCINTLQIEVPWIAEASPLPSPFPLSLNHLKLVAEDGGHAFFSWLLSFPTIPVLKSFEYVGHAPWKFEDSMVRYFERAGEELESLTFERWWGKGEFPPGQSTSNFEVWSSTTHHPTQGALAAFLEACVILDTLALLPASNLKSISIVLPPLFFRRSPGNEDIEVPWSALDKMLADIRFRNLRNLSICMGQAGRRPEVSVITPRTQRLMPLATARGLLGPRPTQQLQKPGK